MLGENERLRNCYEFSQLVMHFLKIRDKNGFRRLLEEDYDLSEYLETSRKSLKRNLVYIENTMDSSLNNGRIEGIINKIKLIKRTSFGYRSFTNFRNRIFLICQGK